jgi:hypothetical protein
MDGRPTGTPPPDSLRAAWSGHLRDQRRVVLNLRHLTVLQTPKTGQNDTILGVLFVQMHKMVLRSRSVAFLKRPTNRISNSPPRRDRKAS